MSDFCKADASLVSQSDCLVPCDDKLELGEMQTIQTGAPVDENKLRDETHAGRMVCMRGGTAGEVTAMPGSAIPFLPELRNYQVGGLTFLLGRYLAFSAGQREGNSVSLLDDWVLIYRRAHNALPGERDEAPDSPTIRIQSASCPVSEWSATEEMMLVHFPRATFKGLENFIEAICSRRAEFPASPILLAYLDSLWHYLPLLQENEQHVVEAVTNQLVRACVARTEEQGSASRPASRSKLEAAKRYIDERISAGGGHGRERTELARCFPAAALFAL